MKKKSRPVFFLSFLGVFFLFLPFFHQPVRAQSCEFKIHAVDEKVPGKTINCPNCNPPTSCVSNTQGFCFIDFGSDGNYDLDCEGLNSAPHSINCDEASLYWIDVHCNESGAPNKPGPPNESGAPNKPGPPNESGAPNKPGPPNESGAPNKPGPPPGGTYPKCQSKAEDIRVSWPNPCEGCNYTGYQDPSCAQSFYVLDSVKVKNKDCQCEITLPDGSKKYYARIEWGGTVSVDFSQTKVPFAGKTKEPLTGQGKKKKDYEIHEDEIMYLADYFEGTHEYYRDYYLGTFNLPYPWWAPDLNFFGENPFFTINHEGVLRKLTPHEYQNELKREMIERVLASKEGQMLTGQVRDYQVNYPRRLCWQAPLWARVVTVLSQKMPIFNPPDIWKYLDFCLYDIKSESYFNAFEIIMKNFLRPLGFDVLAEFQEESFLSDFDADGKLPLAGERLPPKLGEEDYWEKWEAWRTLGTGFHDELGKWFKLWQTVPMVSREDTNCYLEKKGNEYVEVPNIIFKPQIRKPDTWDGPTESHTRYPHLARLYEASYRVQEILLPEEIAVSKTSDENMYAFKNQDNSFATQTEALALAPADSASPPNLLAASSLVQTNSKCLANQVLGEECEICPIPSIENISISNNWVHYVLKICHNCPGFGPIGDVHYGNDCKNMLHDCNVPQDGCCQKDSGFPQLENVAISCPGSATITACIRCAGCPTSCQYNQCGCISCKVTVDEDCNIIENTYGPTTPGPPPPDQGCLGPVPFTDECVKPAVGDTNPNDTICTPTPALTGELEAVDEIENTEGCLRCLDFDCTKRSNPLEWYYCCVRTRTVPVTRQFAIDLLIPYLSNSWNLTSAPKQGFFNYFRPAEKANAFEDIDAKSIVSYSYGHGNVEPSIGEFYYPFLGGIQLNKQWILGALTPLNKED